MFLSNFHLSTLFQHFGGQYIKFIVTYCNTKRGKRNIWLLLIVSTNLHQIKKNTAFPKTENFVEFISRNVWRQSQVMFMWALCYIFFYNFLKPAKVFFSWEHFVMRFYYNFLKPARPCGLRSRQVLSKFWANLFHLFQTCPSLR